MLKNGLQHTQSLRDGRAVYINGKRVADVPADRAFHNAVGTVAKLFDFSSAPENQALMTYAVPETGARASRIWQLPLSYDELVERRKALEALAEQHCGFFGRAPDHVASCISGMFMGLGVFEDYDPARARALADYYRYARDNDVYLAYVIINPPADRSKGASQQKSEFFNAGVVDRDHEGITLRGAKMLATGGVMANEVLVSCIQPLQPGDEKHAISLVVPMNAKGLKILSRKSYEYAAPDIFDNPLASRFDENDSVLYFDDVKVPWERVFIIDNLAMCQKQFHATPAHIYQNYQAMVRLMVKLRFLAGIGRRIAEVNGIISLSPVREMLGQLAAEVGMVEGLVVAMEAKGTEYGPYFVPDRHTLYTALVLTQQLYPKIIGTLRELGSGSMIMLPSSVHDFALPEVAALIDKTQQSPAADAKERVKFYKLAWDAVGSEFASRHVQYEMLYAGATPVTKGHSFRTYDWARSAGMLDRMLASYRLEDEVTPHGASALQAIGE
jgi:4-hydroxyphenylacetate 3-monooxygenase